VQYGSPSFSMGDEALVAAAANAPVTRAQSQAARAELGRMKKALTAWLKYRGMNDAIATGRGSTIPTPLLKHPRAYLPSPEVMALRLARARTARETELATQLYQLLGEVFDTASLPSPDLTKNPNAAVELARIAVAGALPTEAAAQSPQGFIWLWPLVIVVGAIAFVIMGAIRSSAESAAEHEKLECIKAGKCTDAGFWLKVAAVGFVGWLLWDKAGLGARIMKGTRR
jgi:hypothetical protein